MIKNGTEHASLSILGLWENAGFPCSVGEVAVRLGGRGSDGLRHAWSFVLLMEFYPLPFQSGQTINRTTAKRDRLTQQ